jgi:hypothetical protein
VSRDPQTNDALVTLRNPYGTNRAVGEGNQNIGVGWNTSNPEITVSLNRLVRDGSFGEFNIGPAPRVQSQQQGTSEPATPGQPGPATPAPQPPTNTPNAPANDAVSPAAPAPAPLSLADPRDPNHTDHRLYKQIETGVARNDAEKGRVFDQSSERLMMCTFCDTKVAGITSADHIAINETGKRQQDGSQIAAGTLLFVVQGQDPSDPAARRSMTDVAQAVERPVEQSLQKVDTLTQQQAHLLAQSQNSPTQDDAGPKGPRIV